MEEDIRIYKTKQNIYHCLIDLLEVKTFNKITIKDICNQAMISKSTFYAHFKDKYDLIEKVVQQKSRWFERLIKERFTAIHTQQTLQVVDSIVKEIVSNDKEILYLLEVHENHADFEKSIHQILHNLCLDYLKSINKPVQISLEFIADLYAEVALVSMRMSLKNFKSDQQMLNTQTEFISKIEGSIFELIFADSDHEA